MPISRCQLGQQELDAICNSIYPNGKLVVFTGAGISTSCGIPDFRSSDGLYNAKLGQILSSDSGDQHRTRLSKSQSNLTGKDLFTATILHTEEGRQSFLKFCAALHDTVEQVETCSRTHQFISKLRKQGRITRCYTQNIDGLERKAGLSTQNDGNDTSISIDVIQLHGDLHTIRCSDCSHTEKWTPSIKDAFQHGSIPHCPTCLTRSQTRSARGQRATRIGYLRPRVVLFNEPFYDEDVFQLDDLEDTYLNVVLIMGTSLQISAFVDMIYAFSKRVQHRDRAMIVCVNRTPPRAERFRDIHVKYFEMDCDEWVTSVEEHWETLQHRQWMSIYDTP